MVMRRIESRWQSGHQERGAGENSGGRLIAMVRNMVVERGRRIARRVVIDGRLVALSAGEMIGR
jgi:hypothetical protein